VNVLLILETSDPTTQYSDNTLRCCKYKRQLKKVKGKICPRTGHENPEGEPKEDHLPIKYGVGLNPGPVWTGAKTTPTPHPEFEPRTVQPVASRYTDWDIPARKRLRTNIVWNSALHLVAQCCRTQHTITNSLNE
jgi:hypothetical protein